MLLSLKPINREHQFNYALPFLVPPTAHWNVDSTSANFSFVLRQKTFPSCPIMSFSPSREIDQRAEACNWIWISVK